MIQKIKMRQIQHQHLLEPVESLTVVRDLCGIQAQYLSHAFHAISIRAESFKTTETIGLVKSWSNRGTMHIFAQEDLPLFLHEGRRRFLRPYDTFQSDDCITKERKQYFAEIILESVSSGTDTREDLRAVCCSRGMTERESESVFNPWGGLIRALCEEGKMYHRVQEKKAFCLCPPFVPMKKENAELELLKRYFTNYGPATVQDAAYFFAVSQAQVKKHLNELPVDSVRCNGKIYYSIENRRSDSCEIPQCIFLAGFDPLLLGYQKTESLYLPLENLRKVFTMAGSVRPVILFKGTIIATWKKKESSLFVELFKPDFGKEKQIIEGKAKMLWPDIRHIKWEEA